MNRLLEHGVLPFLLGKYLLTVIGLPVLLIFKNYYLFGTRVRVGYLIPLLVVLYASYLGINSFSTHAARVSLAPHFSPRCATAWHKQCWPAELR